LFDASTSGIFDWSSDGKWLATTSGYVEDQAAVYIYSGETFEEIRIFVTIQPSPSAPPSRGMALL
jgi:hypothetical protein